MAAILEHGSNLHFGWTTGQYILHLGSDKDAEIAVLLPANILNLSNAIIRRVSTGLDIVANGTRILFGDKWSEQTTQSQI